MEEQLKDLIKAAVREVLVELENKKPQEVISAKELSKWLGVSAAWISTNKDRLGIPYFKMGGSDKFYRSDVEKWIEGQKENIELERQFKPKTFVKVSDNKVLRRL